MSFRLGADYVKTLYGSPSEAKVALQANNLNYFLISTDLAINDPLAASALFHPNTISEQLGVVWTDGVTALLTWKTDRITDNISMQWLSAYRERVTESKIDLASIHSPNKHIALILSELRSRKSNQDLRQLYWYGGIENLLPPRREPQAD
jgi:hypothetical protein